MSDTTPPNVVYILTDDQRSDLLGCAGHPLIETPHLDRLAADGVRFGNAFCTSPLCTPSRTGHYLGQWERRHGVNFNSGTAVAPGAWADSFPSRLREAGYFTGWVGKNHVPVGEGGYGSGLIEASFDYWYGNHKHSGFYPKEQAMDGRGGYANASADTQAEIFEEGIVNFLDPEGDGSMAFRESAARELPTRSDDRPFCLCVTFNLPHDYGTGRMQLRPTDPGEYVSRYRDRFDDVPVPASYSSSWAVAEPKLPREVYSGEWLPGYDYVRSRIALRERLIRQYQTVSAVDRVVGRIRETLERLGEAENTLVVFSTDHGLMLGEHGLGGKAFLYDPATRIPLLVYDPRAPPAAQDVRDEFVVVPDLAPTVLDLAGVEIPDAMQGRSLRPLLYDEQVDGWRDEVFVEQMFDWQDYPMSEGVRTERWKYVRYFERTPDPESGPRRATLDSYRDRLASAFDDERPVYEELYYLVDDPRETVNLAEEPERAEKLNELRDRTDELVAEHYDGPPCTVAIDPS